uniref:tRNA ligase phosphodiesterase domain-containing protein n=1 Tax=Nymphaea colorata TaxID=210225 RepID=A0A5K1AB63_9MAGN
MAKKHQKVKKFLQDKNLEKTLTKAHVTLAHKRSHGVTSVASYGIFLNQKVPVDFTALLFSQNLAALEAQIGSIDGEKVASKNEWAHVTLWAGNGASAKDANMLSQLVLKGEAARVDFHKPVSVSGVVDFY